MWFPYVGPTRLFRVVRENSLVLELRAPPARHGAKLARDRKIPSANRVA